MSRVLVVGAGAWGTALALSAERAGCLPTLWARDPELASEVETTRTNARYLPGVLLPSALRVTADPAAAADADIVLFACPAQGLRALAERLRPHVPPGTPLVSAAKGIEIGTGALMTQVLGETCPDHPLAVLSGPTFAMEVAHDMPSAVTVACADETLGHRLLTVFGHRTFRPYLSSDLVGVQVGGAVKNVIAIASGIVAGRGWGDNARAALVTRGLAEIMRLGRAMGADPRTLMGLSGLGDLTLTCTSGQSRNTSLGQALGSGRTMAEINAGRRTVVEGVTTAAALVPLAAQLGVEVPITAAVDAIVNHGADLDEMMDGLLSRPFRPELD